MSMVSPPSTSREKRRPCMGTITIVRAREGDRERLAREAALERAYIACDKQTQYQMKESEPISESK